MNRLQPRPTSTAAMYGTSPSAGPTSGAGSSSIATINRPLPTAIHRDVGIGPKNSSDTIDGSSTVGKNGECSPPDSAADPTTNSCAPTLIAMNAPSMHLDARALA